MSHCRTDERILYSCGFARNQGSVCLKAGAIHYRFGPPGRPEIDLASNEDWSNIHIGNVVGQGGGHQSHVRFTSGRHHYVVFEGQNGSLADVPGRRYSGIFVAAGEDGGEQLANLECSGRAVVPDSFAALMNHAPSAIRDRETLWEQQNGPFDAWY